MFHIQTKAHYMTQTILVGGAKYRATGRGFVTQHTPMDEQFRFFESSHLYLGVELAAGLIIMGIFSDAGQYLGRTWSLWLASLSFLASPFWFNPLTFEWNVVVNDYKAFLGWMSGTSGGPTKSWSQWWNEEHSHYKQMVFTSKSYYLTKSVLYVLVADGIRTSDLFKANLTLNRPWVNVGGLCIVIVMLFALRGIFQSARSNMNYAARQTLGIMMFLSIATGVTVLFIEDSDAIRYSLAGYYFAGAVLQIGLLYGFKFVKNFYFIHDLICGHIIFIPLLLLAALQLPHHIQTWLLYHNALSTDVVISDILRYAQKSQKAGGEKDDADLVEQVQELRKLVQKQEELLKAVGTPNNLARNESTDAIAELIAPSKEETVQIHQPAPQFGKSGMGGRALSMSGMDVWGPMTIGDGDDGIQGNAQDSYQQMNVHSSSTSHQGGGYTDFRFSQPDQMPPR